MSYLKWATAFALLAASTLSASAQIATSDALCRKTPWVFTAASVKAGSARMWLVYGNGPATTYYVRRWLGKDGRSKHANGTIQVVHAPGGGTKRVRIQQALTGQTIYVRTHGALLLEWRGMRAGDVAKGEFGPCL
jgi:hypothetical protein